MLLHKVLTLSAPSRKLSTSCQRYIKVAVVGAGGGVGQPLSMLLKLSPLVTDLRLYDVEGAIGVAVDVSHINTHNTVKGFNGPHYLSCALNKAEIVVMTAGQACKAGQVRDDLFDANAKMVKEVMEACAEHCPEAQIVIMTNPINSLIPLAAEVMKKHGVFCHARFFGLTTLDCIRARTFVANHKGIDPRKVSVHCIGGHSNTTTIPLLSHCKPKLDFKDDELIGITRRVQNAFSEVIGSKGGVGPATLATAFAAKKFVVSLCRGLKGETNVIECAYVCSTLTKAKYFASPVLLGRYGIQRLMPLPSLSKYENQLLKTALPDIMKNIERGEKFLKK